MVEAQTSNTPIRKVHLTDVLDSGRKKPRFVVQAGRRSTAIEFVGLCLCWPHDQGEGTWWTLVHH